MTPHGLINNALNQLKEEFADTFQTKVHNTIMKSLERAVSSSGIIYPADGLYQQIMGETIQSSNPPKSHLEQLLEKFRRQNEINSLLKKMDELPLDTRLREIELQEKYENNKNIL